MYSGRQVGRRLSKRPKRYSPDSSPERTKNTPIKARNKKHCPDQNDKHVKGPNKDKDQTQDIYQNHTAKQGKATSRKNNTGSGSSMNTQKKISDDIKHREKDADSDSPEKREVNKKYEIINTQDIYATETTAGGNRVIDTSIEDDCDVLLKLGKDDENKKGSCDDSIDDDVFSKVTAILSSELLGGSSNRNNMLVEGLAIKNGCELSHIVNGYQLTGSLSCILKAHYQLIKIKQQIVSKQKPIVSNLDKSEISIMNKAITRNEISIDIQEENGIIGTSNKIHKTIGNAQVTVTNDSNPPNSCQEDPKNTSSSENNRTEIKIESETSNPNVIYTKIDNFITDLSKNITSLGQISESKDETMESHDQSMESHDLDNVSHDLNKTKSPTTGDNQVTMAIQEPEGSNKRQPRTCRILKMNHSEEVDDEEDLYLPVDDDNIIKNHTSPKRKAKKRKPNVSGKKRGRKNVHKYECVDYDKGLFRCYKCTYESTLHGVRKHIQRHHGNQVDCEICGRAFGTRFDLRRHEKTHYNKDGTLNHEAELWKLAKQDKQAATNIKNESDLLESIPGDADNKPSVGDLSTVTSDPSPDKSSAPEGSSVSCKHCNLIFSKQEDFMKHEQDHFDEHGELKALTKVYQKASTAICSLCGYSTKEGLLEQHMERNHAEQKGIQCTMCPKMFFTYGDMRRHYTISHQHRENQKAFRSIKKGNPKHLPANYRPVYECSSCSFTTGLRVTLLLHQKIHSKSLKECPLCDFSTIENHLFTKHMKRIHGTADEACEHCDKKFLTQGDLKRHVRQAHLGAEREACEYCGRVFATKVGLKAHVKRVHLKVKTSTCPLCGKEFYDKAHMLDHVESHKPPEEQKKAYTCTYCGRSFRKAMQVKQHENTHTGNRPYQCKYCDKRYAWVSERNKHEIAAHSDTRPFPCTECSRSFKHNFQLQAHTVMHTKSSKHTCQYCGKIYTLAATLKRHRCRMAPPGAYDQRSEVEDMMVLVDNRGNVIETPPIKEEGNLTVFMCGVCNEVFTNKEGINKHMYEHVDSNVTVLIQDENGVIENEIRLESVESNQISEIEAAASALTDLSNVIEGSSSDIKSDHVSNMKHKNQEQGIEQQETMVEISNSEHHLTHLEPQNIGNANIQIISGADVQQWPSGEQVQIYNIAEQNGDTVVMAQSSSWEQPIVTQHGEVIHQIEGQEQVVIAHVENQPQMEQPEQGIQEEQTTT